MSAHGVQGLSDLLQPLEAKGQVGLEPQCIGAQPPADPYGAAHRFLWTLLQILLMSY